MFYVEPYYRLGFPKEVHCNGAYIPKRSQKLKSKRLKSIKKKKRGKR